MHFVKLGPLNPRALYTYSVRGGGPNSVWSESHTFRAGYTGSDGGATRVGLFGDMAVTQYNAVSNLKADCGEGLIDAIWMMGDHGTFAQCFLCTTLTMLAPTTKRKKGLVVVCFKSAQCKY